MAGSFRTGWRSALGVWLDRAGRALGTAPEPVPLPPAPVPLSDDPRLPLYLQAEGGRLQLDGLTLRLTVDGREIATAPMGEVSEVVLIGPVSVTTPCLHALLAADVPVSWHTLHGWFLGHTTGLGGGRLAVRRAQYRASEDAARALAVARPLVAAKIHGQRLLVRRNHKGSLPPHLLLCRLERLEWEAARAESLEALLGLEGAAAALYFAALKELVAPARAAGLVEAFVGRRQRPPTDPLNAALSFAYAMLARLVTVAVGTAGLDPQQGFLHRPRAGRPALALDLMEPLRPLVADSAVLAAINNGRLGADGFVQDDGAVLLGPDGRKALIQAFEQRLGQDIEHPAFARPLPWRAVPAAQARLLGDLLTGARADFPQARPR